MLQYIKLANSVCMYFEIHILKRIKKRILIASGGDTQFDCALKLLKVLLTADGIASIQVYDALII